MGSRRMNAQCALILIPEGFNEIEAVVVLSTLRQAGICAKSVGMIRGAITGQRGISVIADFALADLERMVEVSAIRLLVLPGDERGLARLESDPRVYQLLRRVAAQGGLFATGAVGQRMLHSAELDVRGPEQIVVWEALTQSVEAYAQDLVYRLQ